MLLGSCFFQNTMALSRIDNLSGVLDDFILGKFTVFILVGDLLRMIHEWLFLLARKQDSRFLFGLLKKTPLAFLDSKASRSPL